MADTKISALTAATSLTGAELLPIVQSDTTKSATLEQIRGGAVVSVLDYGADPTGSTNSNAAFAAAVAAVTTVVDTSHPTAALYIPAGRYLITENNWIGEHLQSQAYAGKLDYRIYGDGRNISQITFAPAVSGGACYDQNDASTYLLNGLTIENVGFVLSDANNSANPVHFIISKAAGGAASQNFRLKNVQVTGVAGSVLFDLQGNVNEDMIVCDDIRLSDMSSAIKSTANQQALVHTFTNLEAVNITGNLFWYAKGGHLQVVSAIANLTGTNGVDTALLKIDSGSTGQCYTFTNVRTELPGATTRALLITAAAEHTITFNNCNFANNIGSDQPWAKVVCQHRGSITFRDCVLPTVTGVGVVGTFQLIDSTSGTDYSSIGASRSQITFDNCHCTGDRQNSLGLPWVDYSALTAPNANYRNVQVRYSGCSNIADAVEYGHVYRKGRTASNYVPGKLIFRGTDWPKGDGISAPVNSAADFNVLIPFNAFVTEIVVMRKSRAISTDAYQIEFVDQAERDSPGSGVIFGATTSQNGDLAIKERVSILRQFTGTVAQRTIWARIKTGMATFDGSPSPGDATDGGIYAEVI